MIDRSPIILAVDTVDLDRVDEIIDETRESISIFKFGLEFYLKHGLGGVLAIKERHGIEIFLDLKLHDIPNTVKHAVLSVAEIRPFILTVHAAGGGEMVKVASEAMPETLIAAVTVLTSIDQSILNGLGIERDVVDLVSSFAKVAIAAGAKAIVASPLEVASLKAQYPSIITVTPGIRLDDGQQGDQRRTLTPSRAIEAGSDYLVIGRPITQAPSPREAARAILESIGFEGPIR